jgi:hypothetical protein
MIRHRKACRLFDCEHFDGLTNRERARVRPKVEVGTDGKDQAIAMMPKVFHSFIKTILPRTSLRW